MTDQYGIDINTLDKFILRPEIKKQGWGSSCVVVSLPEYKLERLEIASTKSRDLDIDQDYEATVFVEAGEVKIGKILLKDQEIVTLPPASKHTIQASKDSVLYIFYGLAAEGNYLKKFKPTDFRDKYWGSIQTVVSKNTYAGKRIYLNRGGYASLEYHCQKLESYYVHSGKLLLRLRAGRGQDRFFEIDEGSAVTIPPGLMHQRGGLEDTVIFEISTKDEDADSFLVEDGQKHKMPRLHPPRADFGGQARGKRICFDVDGIIRTQTEGDYENAQPIKKAIDLVNKLYDEGYWITLYTSSFMGRNKGDQRGAYQDGYEFNKKQLESWGVKYHELFMGKPPTDVVVDDRAIFFKPDWELIEKEIRAKLKDTK